MLFRMSLRQVVCCCQIECIAVQNCMKCVAGDCISKAVAYFLKYTVPTKQRNTKYPVSKMFSSSSVSASVPSGFPLVINDAYWKKYRKNVAFSIWLKKEM